MAGNSRFHNKLHQTDHHTNPTPGIPGSGGDPIASAQSPFQGDFNLAGGLSASGTIIAASLSARGTIIATSLSAYSLSAANFTANNFSVASLSTFSLSTVNLYATNFSPTSISVTSLSSKYINFTKLSASAIPSTSTLQSNLFLNLSGDLISKSLSGNTVTYDPVGWGLSNGYATVSFNHTSLTKTFQSEYDDNRSRGKALSAAWVFAKTFVQPDSGHVVVQVGPGVYEVTDTLEWSPKLYTYVQSGLPIPRIIRSGTDVYPANAWKTGFKMTGVGMYDTVIRLVPPEVATGVYHVSGWGTAWDLTQTNSAGASSQNDAKYVILNQQDSATNSLSSNSNEVSNLTVDANWFGLNFTDHVPGLSAGFNKVVGCVSLLGSNNTVRNVRAINFYGAGRFECFAISLGAGNMTYTTNALVEGCVIEYPNGTYHNGVAVGGGMSSAGVELVLDGVVVRNNVFNGYFEAGAINMYYTKNTEIYNNVFTGGASPIHQDTGTLDGLSFHNNRVSSCRRDAVFIINDPSTIPAAGRTKSLSAYKNISIKDNYFEVNYDSNYTGYYSQYPTNDWTYAVPRSSLSAISGTVPFVKLESPTNPPGVFQNVEVSNNHFVALSSTVLLFVVNNIPLSASSQNKDIIIANNKYESRSSLGNEALVCYHFSDNSGYRYPLGVPYYSSLSSIQIYGNRYIDGSRIPYFADNLSYLTTSGGLSTNIYDFNTIDPSFKPYIPLSASSIAQIKTMSFNSGFSGTSTGTIVMGASGINSGNVLEIQTTGSTGQLYQSWVTGSSAGLKFNNSQANGGIIIADGPTISTGNSIITLNTTGAIFATTLSGQSIDTPRLSAWNIVGQCSNAAGLGANALGCCNTASGNSSTVIGGFSGRATGCASIVGGLSSIANGRASVAFGEGNIAPATYSTIVGGLSNQIYLSAGSIQDGEGATIGGGAFNYIRGIYSIIGGGACNCIVEPYSDSTSAATLPLEFYPPIEWSIPSTIVGGFCNISCGVGTAIGGGSLNYTCCSYSTIGGGTTNLACEYSTIAGGSSNNANTCSFIGGGSSNIACCNGVVAGGSYNIACGNFSTIGGGGNNKACGYFSTIGGGQLNTACCDCSTIAGGYANDASGTGSTIGGGSENVTLSSYSTIGGGCRNKSGSFHAGVIAGGCCNCVNITSSWGVVGGGQFNCSYGDLSTIAGGGYSTANGPWSTVGGGVNNCACTCGATVGGGQNNCAWGNLSTVAGGGYNIALSAYSTIAGGFTGLATNCYSTVVGGFSGSATGVGSIVGGLSSRADGRAAVAFGEGSCAIASAATIGGGNTNAIVVAAVNSTIAGGRANLISGTGFSTIGGGASNCITDSYSTIGGGTSNCVLASTSTIAGGILNNIGNSFATIGGGCCNIGGGGTSVIGGGFCNCTINSGNCATIGGGSFNIAFGCYSTVIGGFSGSATGVGSIVGGLSSRASGRAAVAFGEFSIASGDQSFVGGGFCNKACSFRTTVAGGAFNNATFCFSTIGGGNNNNSTANGSTIAGGTNNTASTNFATVGGGNNNSVTGGGATVGGGESIIASGSYSTIGGGCCNCATVSFSTIIGGFSGTATGLGSIVGGLSSRATGRAAIAFGEGNLAIGANSTIIGGLNSCVCSTACNTSVVGSCIRAVSAYTTYANNMELVGCNNVSSYMILSDCTGVRWKLCVAHSSGNVMTSLA